jgi:hypothetical protein
MGESRIHASTSAKSSLHPCHLLIRLRKAQERVSIMSPMGVAAIAATTPTRPLWW